MRSSRRVGFAHHSAARRWRPIPRTRRALFEPLEDRRLLATAVADEFQVAPGQTIGVSLLGNDSFMPFATMTVYDQDGEPYDELDPAYWGFLTSPSHGGMANVVSGGPQQNDYSTDPGPEDYSSDFSFDYTADADFQGYDSFTYYLADGYDAWTLDNASTATVTILVDEAPAVADDFYSTSAGTPLDGSVLGNDSGCLGATLTASVISGPAHGSVEMNDDGSFTYTPDADFSGRDSFTYSASDGLLDSAASVDIGVGDYIEAPTANDDSLETSYQTPNGIVLLANDTDPQNDPLTATIVDPPSHGSVSGPDPDGYFMYMPANGFSGFDSFTYIANDGHQDSNVATVSVYVSSPPSYPPYAAGESYLAGQNMTLTIPARGVLANDTDPRNYPLTAVLASDAAHGTVTLASDGSFTYAPNTDYTGPDSFTYTADSGQGYSNAATVSLNVAVPPEIDMQAFYSDGRNLKIDYTVSNAAAEGAWRLAVYASSDGVSRDHLLWSGDGGRQLGNYTASFQPTYTDNLQWGDYRLLAVADPAGALPKLSTSDTTIGFGGGAYLAHERLTGKTVLQIQAGDDGDTVTAGLVDSSTLRLTQNGQPSDFDPAAIDAIHFHGGSGDDAFTSDATLPIDEWLFAGDGDNTLIGGAGDDIIFGGTGNDTLTGNDGQNHIAGGGGSDTIADDTPDPLPDVFVANSASTVEGHLVQVVLSLDAPAADEITIPYITDAAAGLLDDSYDNSISGTIVIPAGSQYGLLQLQTLGHWGDAGDYGFSVAFTKPSNAHLKGSSTSVAIYDQSKATTTVTLSPTADSGANVVNGAYFVNEDSEFTGTFSLANPAAQDVTITYHTEDGTATSPDNYEPVSDTVTIPAGETSATFSIDIGELTDAQRANPGSASFTVHIDSITGASLSSGANLDQTVTLVNTLDWGTHTAVVDLNFDRIADTRVDDRFGTPDEGYDGWFADERYVLVKLEGPDDFSESEIRGVNQLTTGSIGLPIPDPNTRYTLSITPVGDLKFGYHNTDTGYIQLGVPTSFTFNSSDLSAYDGQGDFERDFAVLSTDYNTAFQADDPVNNLPLNYHIPITEPPKVVAADETGFTVTSGGTLPIDSDASGNPLGDISENGVLRGSTDTDFADGVLHCGWFIPSGDPGGAYQVLHAQLVDGEGQALGTVKVNDNGSFLYTAKPNVWGEDFFRIIVTDANGRQSLKGTVYVNILAPNLDFKVDIGPTYEPAAGNESVSVADANKKFNDAVKQVTDNVWDAFHFTKSRPLKPPDADNLLVYGLSGFVIGITGEPTDGDFSNVTVTLVPIKLVFANKGPETVNMGAGLGILPGPASTGEHEDQHIIGIPDERQHMLALVGKSLTHVIGFIKGFEKAMSVVKKDNNLRSNPDTLKLLAAISTTGVDVTNDAGTWHNPGTGGADYDINA
jgi:Big-like domain-containing protein/hemolysin type calcium-binding protein/Calx-beta domain-containing protein